VIDLMKRLRDELGVTFVFSTHDPKVMAEAEVTFHLLDGAITEREEHRVAQHA
jgi:putative ABC transport system ATP-binding protein